MWWTEEHIVVVDAHMHFSDNEIICCFNPTISKEKVSQVNCVKLLLRSKFAFSSMFTSCTLVMTYVFIF